ncbi:unnamed product [Ostreococcus tauri]|uniref:Unnamed product n=1 Tax=Ostreococcus tauri TaxID=70448 RepID=A0A096PBG5_OSTTA|nr:unnamed product [Ostreococcus tauri]CEG01927.1 unnamed product [Ostreococcus tauri]|eukprot:XP_003084346.2 unnamed product [Ostreococcus tauri]
MRGVAKSGVAKSHGEATFYHSHMSCLISSKDCLNIYKYNCIVHYLFKPLSL